MLEQPREGLTELLLAPGERAELIIAVGGQHSVESGQSAQQAVLTAAVYDRSKVAMSHGSMPPDSAQALADVRFEPAAAGASQASSRALPASLRAIASFGAPAAHQSVVFSEKMDRPALHHAGASRNGMRAGMAFMINGATFDPARITLTSRCGQVEHWTIENRTDMDHPFHLHGTQFQVLERQPGEGGAATPEPYRAWRDTVNVEPAETVRIATVQQSAGLRIFHCHLFEHEDLGMMGTLRVI